MMRTKIIAANWKMNLSFHEAEDLLEHIINSVESDTTDDVQVIVCPPFPYLEVSVEYTRDTSVLVGAQNIHHMDKGAYTGEVSANMLKSLDVDCCIVGHSERRKYFNEDNELIFQKVKALLKTDISPIFCCGEMIDEREKNQHFDVVKKQLDESIFLLDENAIQKIIVAYEPVWAIGTGVNATPEQAQEMHSYIRKLIENKYSAKVASNISILYGGSCNADNAKEIFSNKDVDGGLIGGASLEFEGFLSIIKSLESV